MCSALFTNRTLPYFADLVPIPGIMKHKINVCESRMKTCDNYKHYSTTFFVPCLTTISKLHAKHYAHRSSQGKSGHTRSKENLFVSCMKFVITTSTFFSCATPTVVHLTTINFSKKNYRIILMRNPHKTSQDKLIEADLISDSSVTGIGGFCMSR